MFKHRFLQQSTSRWPEAIVVICVAVSGCASTRLPLCQKVSELSYPAQGSKSSVNRYAVDEANRLGIEYSQLGPFVAEFRGSVWALAKFESNYHFLVCAVDPTQGVLAEIRPTFMTCVEHAPKWIDAIRSEHPRDLMVTENLYLERCVAR